MLVFSSPFVVSESALDIFFSGKRKDFSLLFIAKKGVLLHIYMPPKGQFTSKGKANLVHVPGGRQDDMKDICPGWPALAHIAASAWMLSLSQLVEG
jgi:hypothetical protein